MGGGCAGARRAGAVGCLRRLRQFQVVLHLLASDGRTPCQKIIYREARLEVVQQKAHGYARSAETGRSVHKTWIDRYNLAHAYPCLLSHTLLR